MDNLEIIIIGKGGTGRELASWANQQAKVIGYLDDNNKDNDIIGPVSHWDKLPENNKLVSALGSYKTMSHRHTVLAKIPAGRFTTLISNNAMNSCTDYGTGFVAFPGTIISVSTRIGSHVLIYHQALVSHDCNIGSFCIISNGAVISGNCTIGENTYIGAGCTIIEDINIGCNCIIAAGATVIKDVPDGSIYISTEKIVNNKYNV